jgi:hypothetical protein
MGETRPPQASFVYFSCVTFAALTNRSPLLSVCTVQLFLGSAQAMYIPPVRLAVAYDAKCLRSEERTIVIP